MKKLCFLLILTILLAGCSSQNSQPSNQATMVSFDIYAINDLHGKFLDTHQQPGLDELSTYLKQSENTILLSTGDMWQGTSESNLTHGFLITDWMNRMDFTAMTLGGHEFDWGEEWVRKNDALAEFPFLGINVYSRETDERVDYCQSSLMVDKDGVQIGIIGAIGDCYYSISSQYTEDIYFKTGPQLTELVKAESEKLRSQGADFIIYTIHDGYDQTDDEPISVGHQELKSYYDTSLSDGFVDLVFEADSHYWYTLVDEHGVYHLQAGGNNQGIAHARVMIDSANGNSYVLISELVPNSQYADLQADPLVEQLKEKYAQQIAPSQKILGINGQYRNSRHICQLVADLYCAKGVEKWGAEYDIVLGGGYMSCRSPGYLLTGEVTYSQLYSLLPFDNPIMLCSIKGRDLLSKFLETDHYAYYIKTTAYGEGIQDAIDPNGTYYVVTDSYSAYYSYNNMTVIDVLDETTFARDLLAAYITQGGLE